MAALLLLSLMLAAYSPPAEAVFLVRQPFIQAPSGDSAIIIWRDLDYQKPKEPGKAVVRYGEDGNFANSVEAQVNFEVATDDTGNGWQHRATLTGLKPDTLYHYQVVNNGEVLLHDRTFRTASAGGKFSFLVFGDSGKGDREEDGQLGVARQIGKYVENCRLALHVGDVAQNESQAHDYQKFFFDYYQDWMSSIPVFPVRGNHDYDWIVDPESGYRSVNWQLSFAVPNANPRKIYDYGRPLTYGEPEEYYRIDYGNAIFLALCIPSGLYYEKTAAGSFPFTDSDYSESRRGRDLAMLPIIKEGSPQHDWMVKELAEARRRIATGEKDWLFVYFHVAYYSHWGHGNVPEIEKAVAADFEKYGVDIVFNGHTHVYERTVPLKQGRKAPEGKGVVYVTSGGGGADLYPRRHRGYETFLNRKLDACFQECHHFVLADVDGKKLRLRAIRWDGKVVDDHLFDKTKSP